MLKSGNCHPHRRDSPGRTAKNSPSRCASARLWPSSKTTARASISRTCRHSSTTAMFWANSSPKRPWRCWAGKTSRALARRHRGRRRRIEHGAAMNHVKFGKAMRRALGYPCKAIVPSTVTRGGPGTTLDVPLIHREANLVRSHFGRHEGQRLRRAPGPTNWSSSPPSPPWAGRLPGWAASRKTRSWRRIRDGLSADGV